MNRGPRRSAVAFVGGLGGGLLLSGLFAAGCMIVIPFQVGLAESWPETAASDPVFYIFAGFAILFLIAAGGGALLCRQAYRLFRAEGSAETSAKTTAD